MYAASPLNKPSAEPDRATVHPLRRDTPVTSRCTRSEGVQCLRIGCTASHNKHNCELFLPTGPNRQHRKQPHILETRGNAVQRRLKRRLTTEKHTPATRPLTAAPISCLDVAIPESLEGSSRPLTPSAFPNNRKAVSWRLACSSDTSDETAETEASLRFSKLCEFSELISDPVVKSTHFRKYRRA